MTVAGEEYAAPDTSPVRLAVTEAIHAMGCLGWKPVDGTDKTYHVCRSVAGNVAAALFHKGLLAEAGEVKSAPASTDDDANGTVVYGCDVVGHPNNHAHRHYWPETTT